jgi:hypothetical protein
MPMWRAHARGWPTACNFAPADSWEDRDETTIAEPPRPAQMLALAQIRARARARTELAPSDLDPPPPTAQAITILAKPSLLPPPGVTLLGVLPRAAATGSPPAETLLGVVPRSAVDEAVQKVLAERACRAEGHRHQLLDGYASTVSLGTAETHPAVEPEPEIEDDDLVGLAVTTRGRIARLLRGLCRLCGTAIVMAIVTILVGYAGLRVFYRASSTWIIPVRANAAVVPYAHAGNVSIGTPVVACRLEVLWCRTVGRVVEILPGELSAPHPNGGAPLRGRVIEIAFEEPEAAQQDVLFLGSAPLWL